MIQRDTDQEGEVIVGVADEELVQQSQAGNSEALTILYHRHLRTVYNRVRYRVQLSDVEDVTQEVFISAIKSLQSFEGTSKFSTWLRTLTDRRIADYYRNRNEKQTELDVDVGEMESGAMADALTVESKIPAADARIIVQRGLNTLPEHYREVIVLRFAEGLKFREIATYRGESLEATKSLFRRAMEFLREQIEKRSDAT